MAYVTHDPIDLHSFLRKTPGSCGASAQFLGIVRDNHGGKAVEKLFYECYEPMAEKQIASIVQRVKAQHGVEEIHVLHRVGWLGVGETAVAIQVAGGHRDEAFAACRAMIDTIKSEVPIWKKEIYADGSVSWVCCHDGDQALHACETPPQRIPRTPIRGIILAGGRSRRFGSDKARALVDGRTLIEKTVKLFRAIGLEPTLIANAAQDYSDLGCRVQRDLIPDKGPLGGLHTAATLFPDAPLLVLTCDMPYVTEALLQQLQSAQEKQPAMATLYEDANGKVQPFPGIYAGLAGLLERRLHGRDISMEGLLADLPTVQKISRPADPRPFSNINARQDLPAEAGTPTR